MVLPCCLGSRDPSPEYFGIQVWSSEPPSLDAGKGSEHSILFSPYCKSPAGFNLWDLHKAGRHGSHLQLHPASLWQSRTQGQGPIQRLTVAAEARGLAWWCVHELLAVCFREEVAQDRVSKQSSYFTQAVGNLAEETEAMMQDTLGTVPVEKKRKRISSIDSLLVARTSKPQKKV